MSRKASSGTLVIVSAVGHDERPTDQVTFESTMSKFRTERDTMGEMQVPVDALYGASTARAVENFPIAHEPVPAPVIHAFGHLKAACAQANLDLGKLDSQIAQSIVASADEVAKGTYDAHFPVDIYQTGSGTSTNMNANEVIANVARFIPTIMSTWASHPTTRFPQQCTLPVHCNLLRS